MNQPIQSILAFRIAAMLLVLENGGRLSAQTPDPAKPAPTEGDIILRQAPRARDVPNSEFRRRIEATGLPWLIRDRVTGIELVLIPPGTYTRGAHAKDRLASPSEKPEHRLHISKAFYLGRFEVTTAQFGRFKPPRKPRQLPWWRSPLP